MLQQSQIATPYQNTNTDLNTSTATTPSKSGIEFFSKHIAQISSAMIAFVAVSCALIAQARGDLVVVDRMTDANGNAVSSAIDNFWDRTFAPESIMTGIAGTAVIGMANHNLGKVEFGLQFATYNYDTSQYEYVTGPLDLSTLNLGYTIFYAPDQANFSIANIESGNGVHVYDATLNELINGSGSSLITVEGRESYYFGFDAGALNWASIDGVTGMVGIAPYYLDYETNFDLDLLVGLTLSSNAGSTVGLSGLSLHQYGLESPTSIFDKTGYPDGLTRVSFVAIPEPSSGLLIISTLAAASLQRRRRD